MRKYEATEGDIRLRRGARIKRNKAGLYVEESRSAPHCFGMLWGGGGGKGFVYLHSR